VSDHEHEVVTRVLSGWLNIDQVDQLSEFARVEYGSWTEADHLCRSCLVDVAAELV
jgi:hypothetical protein